MRVFVSFEDSTFVASSEQYTTVADLLRHVSTLPRAPPVALLRAVLTLEQRRTPLAPETRLDSLRNRSDVIVECIPATNSAEGEKTRGNALLAAGRASEACACYTAALAMPEATGPLRAALLLNRSLARAKLGEWRPAEQDARLVAEEDPENVKAWFRVGQALFGARKFEEAHEVLGRAIDLEGLQQAQAVEIGKLLQRCEKEHSAGLKGVSAEIISEARAAHLPVAAYVRLKPFYSMALTAMEQKKWAAAEETYRRILDVVNPEDYTSLFGLAAVLLTNKSHRYDEACRVLEKVCALHPEFGPWRMLGEAQLGVKQYDAAMASFAKAANFLSSGPSTQVQVERTKDLNVQISKTTLAQGKLDLALHYVSNVLKADDSDLRALIQYGHVLLKMGSDSEDELVKVALRVVAAQPKDRDVRRLFCTVLKVPGMVPKLLQMLHLVGGGKMGPSSFAFLASIAKEYSAVDAAIVLLRHAVELGGYASPTDVLSLVHVLEIDCRDNEALDVIRTWLEKNPEFSLGSLNAGRVLEAWKSPSPRKEPFVLRDDIGVKGKGKPDWTAAELDFLAMLFCLVKLLYLTRQFDNISSIVELIEPVRSQWELHLTTIRNEQAFYCCSVQCLESRPSVEDASRVVHVVGDSHCLPCAWQRTGDGQTTSEAASGDGLQNVASASRRRVFPQTQLVEGNGKHSERRRCDGGFGRNRLS